jgi:hypothetical protein
MFMAGYTDEASFDRFIQGINAEGLGTRVTFPYLVLGGEDDDFAAIEATFDVLNEVKAPKEFVLYKAEGHTLHSRPSSSMEPSDLPCSSHWPETHSTPQPTCVSESSVSGLLTAALLVENRTGGVRQGQADAERRRRASPCGSRAARSEALSRRMDGGDVLAITIRLSLGHLPVHDKLIGTDRFSALRSGFGLPDQALVAVVTGVGRGG